jgi:exodeoxyribonuclease VII small subunit
MGEELDSASFNKNYQILKQTADWLSTQKEPDIDQLVPKVEKAMKAYSICKERLDLVQTTLGQYFPKESAATETATATGGARPARNTTSAAPGADGDDEDTPF